MNIQIITSSYPAYPGDPTASAGLFVNAFALELSRRGHRVIVQPIARKEAYRPDEGLIIEPIPWKGGDVVLAQMNLYNPEHLWTIFHFFLNAKKFCLEVHRRYAVDYTVCMWAIPCGIVGYWVKGKFGKPYDVWVLGSDIWKISSIPWLGPALIRLVLKNASRIFADGLELCKAVESITKRSCPFLASSRQLPPGRKTPSLVKAGKVNLLYVGRYYTNKGPDLLIEALRELTAEDKHKVHAHLFGFGEMKQDLAALIRKYQLEGTVSLHDGIEPQELSDFLKSADFLVIPSRIESIPVIFSDAMQMGTPVISMPVGDLPSLIERYDCGVVAAAVSAKELSKAISTAIREGAQKFSAGTQEAARQFSIKQVCDDWLNAIRL